MATREPVHTPQESIWPLVYTTLDGQRWLCFSRYELPTGKYFKIDRTDLSREEVQALRASGTVKELEHNDP